MTKNARTNALPKTTHENQSVYDYSGFHTIDGRHPFQQEVPGSHVMYRVRRRKNGKVAWFNFDLARDMGLLAPNHPNTVTPALESTLLETFSIQIINEYDLINQVKIDPSDIKPNFYMATRYLQLQHPGRTGKTSGDGRSIWNGTWTHQKTTWDISSCGTGATCLSPATHKYKKFFRTGDPAISYGCGYSDLDDGITGAIFSEILHRNGHETERCLLVIEYPNNLSINVRAGKNLLRPSHFFNHLKQGNLPRLKAAVDYHIRRETINRALPPVKGRQSIYQNFVDHTARVFGEMAARFERDYIFCWLAWDGDNILTNGGIIDYGSIRQFGLFHHEYRFDDVERWSTSIVEQKAQARYIVQTFIQIADFIESGQKKALSAFKNHPTLKLFDQAYLETKTKKLVEKIGLPADLAAKVIKSHPDLIKRFDRSFTWFERQTRKTKKPYKVADGVTRDALYSMRDILRLLPEHYLKARRPMTPHEFMKAISSTYCSKKDSVPSRKRSIEAQKFQTAYFEIIAQASSLAPKGLQQNLMETVNERSSVINRRDRITGDAVCTIGAKVIREKKQLSRSELYRVLMAYVSSQTLVPELTESAKVYSLTSERLKRMVTNFMKITHSMREGL